MISAAAFSLLTTAAFADATIQANENSKSNGSSIGQQSSGATGNGAWVSGNNLVTGDFGPGQDQTTYPGSRADLVHASNGDKPGQANK